MNPDDNQTVSYSLSLWKVLFCLLLFQALPTFSLADSPLMLTYQPSRGFAGVTVTSQAGILAPAPSAGTPLTIGGVDASGSIMMWSDGMVIAKVPEGATTGEIVVNTDHGSVSSSEAAAFQWELGTGAVNSNFIVDPIYLNKAPDSSLLQECPDATGFSRGWEPGLRRQCSATGLLEFRLASSTSFRRSPARSQPRF